MVDVVGYKEKEKGEGRGRRIEMAKRKAYWEKSCPHCGARNKVTPGSKSRRARCMICGRPLNRQEGE